MIMLLVVLAVSYLVGVFLAGNVTILTRTPGDGFPYSEMRETTIKELREEERNEVARTK
jgi:hypothetical protein